MKALFLTVSLGLIAILQAQDSPASSEDTPAVSGKWYLKAMITDREMPEKKPESVTPMTVTVLKGGNLRAEIFLLVHGQCEELTVVLEKTSEPGKYTAYGGKRVVYIKPAQVKGHYFLHCEGELHGKQVQMAKLIGRDPENNEEALKNFREFSRARGFSQEVFLPKQIDTCPPGKDQGLEV